MNRCLICQSEFNENNLLHVHGHRVCLNCARDPELYECLLIRLAEINLTKKKYRVGDLIQMAKTAMGEMNKIENHLLTEELKRFEKIT